jgi:hypothetical protein
LGALLLQSAKKEGYTKMVYHCWHCDEATNFIVLNTHILPEEGPPEEYSFAQCEKCHKPALFYRENMGDGFDKDSFYRLYPPHDRHIGYYLPDVVRASYEEAVACENSKTWIACAVMVGRTLEAICVEYDPATKTMFATLKSMLANGVISQELYDWANELRVIRNYGAHATSQSITRQDAMEALDFLQAILEIMYELRPKFKKMQDRRKKTP